MPIQACLTCSRDVGVVFERRGGPFTRKVNEHIRHAYTGVPYVLCKLWEVVVVLDKKKCARLGMFLMFFVFWEGGEGAGMLPVR